MWIKIAKKWWLDKRRAPRASRFVWIKMRFSCSARLRREPRASRFVWIKIAWSLSAVAVTAHELRASCGLKYRKGEQLRFSLPRASRFVWIKMSRTASSGSSTRPRASRFVWIKMCRYRRTWCLLLRHELRASCGLKCLHKERSQHRRLRHELRASCGLKWSWPAGQPHGGNATSFALRVD